MNRKILFVAILAATFGLVSFLASSESKAQNNKTLLILKAGREITIDYKKAIAPSSAQYWKENGKEYLIWSSWRDTTIVFTNLENLTAEKIIPVPNPLNRNLFMFEYKGKDSLYLAFNAGDFPNYWHDSSLIRVGEKGQLLETFCFDSLPVFAANNTDDNQNKENASYGQYFYTSSFVGKNKVFMPLSSYRVLNEDSNFNQKKFSPLAYLTKKEGNVFANLKFPDLNIPRNLNGFIARDYHHSLLCVGKTGQPVLGFGYVPDIFWLDNKGKWQQKTVNSCLVDSNKLTLFPDRYKAPQNDFSLAMYSHLYFLKAAKKYIRAVRLPNADSSQRYQRFGNEPRFSFILFDIDNQKIKIEAEGILPAQFAGALAFFDDKGVWLWNKEKSMKEKKMFLQYFSFEFEKLASPAELKKRLSAELK